MTTSIKQYNISDRLRNAFKALGQETLREGLWILSQNPDLIVIEDVGVDEHYVKFRFYHLNEADVELIKKLTKKLGVRTSSAVVRQAIEVLIDKYELTQFKKPEGWRSRPLTPRTAGSRGVNPMGKHRQSYKNKCLVVPIWLWHQLEEAGVSARKRGVQGVGTKKSNFSAFCRNAIDSVESASLSPLTDAELAGEKRNIAVLLFDYQHSLLSKLNKKQFGSDNQVLLAILKQSVDRKQEVA